MDRAPDTGYATSLEQKNLASNMRRNCVKNSVALLSMYLSYSQISTARNSSCVYRRRCTVLGFFLARSLASFRPHSALDLCVRNEPKRRRTQPHRPVVSNNMASFSADPPAAAAVPRRNTTGIVWFKHTDLRLQDHEPLALAHRDCSHVAHVFCVDDRWLGFTK